MRVFIYRILRSVLAGTGLVIFVCEASERQVLSGASIMVQQEPALRADLSISSSVYPLAAQDGFKMFAWSVTITNGGPDDAELAKLTATVVGPGALFRVSDSVNNNLPNPFTRAFPILRAGQSETVVFEVRPNLGGLFHLIARVEGTSDFNDRNNVIEVTHSAGPRLWAKGTYEIPANDLDFDPATGNMFLTVRPQAGGFGSSVAILDLNRFQLSKIADFSSEPGLLAIASTNRVGYLGTNQNRALVPFSVHPFFIGEAHDVSELGVLDIVIRPGTTNVLVVTTGLGTMILTNGVGSYLSDQLAAAAFDPKEPDVVFLLDRTFTLSRHRLGETNTLEASRSLSLPGLLPLIVINGRIVLAEGQMFDAVTLEPIGELPDVAPIRNLFTPVYPTPLVAANHAANRIYFLKTHSHPEISIFNAENFSRLGTVPVDSAYNPVRLRAHGSHVAFLQNNQRVYLARLPELNETELAIQAADVDLIAGLTRTIVLTVQNNSPWASSNMVVEVTLPPDYTVDLAPGDAAYELTGETMRIHVPFLSAFSATQLRISGKAPEAGIQTARASIISDMIDVEPGNNSTAFFVKSVPMPFLEVEDMAIPEGTLMPITIPMTFKLSRPVPIPTAFTLTLTNGTGTPRDLLATTTRLVQSISFLPNTTNVTHQFVTKPNSITNENRTLTLQLSTTSLLLARSNVTLTILDDDASAVLFAYSPSVPILEALTNRATQIVLPLSSRPATEGRVSYRFLSETALRNVDFVAEDGHWMTQTGSAAGLTLPITILADSEREGPETLILEFTNAHNIGLPEARLRILIDDPPILSATIMGTSRRQGKMAVTFTTTRGRTYQLQRAESLDSTEWINVGDVALHASGAAELVDPDSTFHQRMFYRVEERSLF